MGIKLAIISDTGYEYKSYSIDTLDEVFWRSFGPSSGSAVALYHDLKQALERALEDEGHAAEARAEQAAESAWLRHAEYDPEAEAFEAHERAMGCFSFEEAMEAGMVGRTIWQEGDERSMHAAVQVEVGGRDADDLPF